MTCLAPRSTVSVFQRVFSDPAGLFMLQAQLSRLIEGYLMRSVASTTATSCSSKMSIIAGACCLLGLTWLHARTYGCFIGAEGRLRGATSEQADSKPHPF